MSGKGHTGPAATATEIEGNSVINRHKNATVWSYPEGYVDSREGFPFAVERFYKYFYEKGKLNCTFCPPESAAIKALAFRSELVTPELKAELLKIRDDADYIGAEVDQERVRMLCNDYYSRMKKSAEEELLDNQRKTAGTAIYKATMDFTPPAQCYKRWGLESDEETEDDKEREKIRNTKLEKLSRKGVSKSSKHNKRHPSPSSPQSTSHTTRKSPSKEASQHRSHDHDSHSRFSNSESETDNHSHAHSLTHAHSHNSHQGHHSHPGPHRGDADAAHHKIHHSDDDNGSTATSTVKEEHHRHAHNYDRHEPSLEPSVELSVELSLQPSAEAASSVETLDKFENSDEEYGGRSPPPKGTSFKRDPKYMSSKSVKESRKLKHYAGSKKEEIELKKKTNVFPFNFGCTIKQDVPEGDGHGYNYRLFFYCLANETCRKKGTHFELDKGDWKVTEDIVANHVRVMHWQQMLQTGQV